MSMFDDFEDGDDEEPPVPLDDLPPTVAALSRFAATLGHVSWFAAVGERISEPERRDAEDYLAALGFPECDVVQVMDWEEAEEAARNPEWNTAWWEAEEQLRAALSDRAVELAGDEETVLVALTNVTSKASEAVHGAAAVAASRFGVADEGLIRAAAGAAAQAAYQAALVIAAAEEEDHAFARKFALFQAGRWPLGITGGTFSLF
ncbi:MAG: hypothetical protein TEF_03565 [Rhizobiales bacterium NRL2]|jgi:hypothetical protein|nr:MAG: hypothetical protein TEF_03565 [Rhizobiales bacterium NRL2]